MTAALPAAPRGRLALALGALYLAWGSTYLAIGIAVESVPPLALGAVRFLIAGGLLYAVVRPRSPRPSARQWRSALIVGTLLLGGGNGLVCVAEQRVPSGITALIVATTPLWMTVLPWLGGGTRPSAATLVGIALGTTGVALLGWTGDQRIGVAGVLLVLGAALSWSIGSLASRRLEHAPSPWLATAMQMLAGGAALAVVSLAWEGPRLADVHPASAAWWALAYLVVGGAIIGFGAYVYLLRVARPVVATSYAYVNPLVAVALGWLIRGEPIGLAVLAPGALIVAAVALILGQRR